MMMEDPQIGDVVSEAILKTTHTLMLVGCENEFCLENLKLCMIGDWMIDDG